MQSLARYLLEKYHHDAQPETLHHLYVLLPNNRSITSLKEALFALCPKGLLLPNMIALSDIGNSSLMPFASGRKPATLSSHARLSLTTHYIMRHSDTPLDMVQATHHAQSLLSLRDDIARAGSKQLPAIPQDAFAAHWKERLLLFERVMNALDDWMSEHDYSEPIPQYHHEVDALIQHWKHHPPSIPVVAAGSTGSQPATARLLRAIAQLTHGHVILPGLDGSMPQEMLQHVSYSHPQYHIHSLLASMGLAPKDVSVIRYAPDKRETFTRHVMTPAALGDQLQSYRPDSDVTEHITLTDVTDDVAEAQYVALAVREALTQTGQHIAIISEKQTFIRTLTALLQQAGIPVNHAAGLPAEHHPAWQYTQLLANILTQPYRSSRLLALLRHPYFMPSYRKEALELATLLDQHHVRGWHSYTDLATVLTDESITQTMSPAIRTILTLISDNTVSAYAVTPCITLLHQHSICTKASTQGLNADQAAIIDQLLLLLESIGQHQPGSRCIPIHYSHLLQQYIVSESISPDIPDISPVSIIGAMEARSIQADMVIIPHMNEGNWPPAPGRDPWLNVQTRRQLALNADERRIGLAAHDLAMMLQQIPHIVCTRAANEQNTPMQSSRFFERLKLLVPPPVKPPLSEWRRHMAQATGLQPLPNSAPAPTPDVQYRMKRVSASVCEALMCNPFDVYVSPICGLRARDPIDEPFNRRLFGVLLHKAVQEAATHYDNEEHYYATLQYKLYEDLKHYVPEAERQFYAMQLQHITENMIAEERHRYPDVAQLTVEQNLEYTLNTPLGEVTLHARIDRIESYHNGTSAIIDHKTGAVPPATEVKAGRKNQLLVASLLHLHHAKNTTVKQLEYWEHKGRDTLSKVMYPSKTLPDIDWQQTEEQLGVMLGHYCYNPLAAYIWNPPSQQQHYSLAAHIARVGEW